MWRSIPIFFASIILALSAPQSIGDVGIVGGKDAKIEQYPYQASLEFNGKCGCGATILSEKWVLTAAHCTNGQIEFNMKIRVNSSKCGEGGQVLRVKKFYQHPKFVYKTIDYDISVLELRENIQFDKGAQPIPIIEANKEIAAGSNATITGWGDKNEHGTRPQTLQVAFVPIVGRKECINDYAELTNITERMICAGYDEGKIDSCTGDSGGPLVVDGKVTGIVSFGFHCARAGYPGVYTNISNLRQYIKEITGL